MGYDGFSLKEILRALFAAVSEPWERGPMILAYGKAGSVTGQADSISDFLQ
jgi:hypothetical protein